MGEIDAVVAVDGELFDRHRALWDALEQVIPVRFAAGPVDGAIGAIGDTAMGPDTPRLVVPARQGDPRGQVRVRTTSAVPEQSLAAMDLLDAGVELEPLTPSPGETVLAESDAGPVWLMSGEKAGARSFRSARALPDLAAGRSLRSHLTVGDFLALAPLVTALREWLGEAGWSEPDLRATFLFDDINLHGRRYGFVPFESLLRDATEHGYHVVMATIPLDAWFTHPRAKRVFGDRHHLSLVFHGNDHTNRELASVDTRDDALGMLAQALRRVERFERRSELSVDRVMTPPHGACSTPVAEALFGLGYRAMCIDDVTSWSSDVDPEPALHGWYPIDMVAGGLPVIPRTLFEKDPRELAFRAFLRHPLVIYGHHEDLADGLDLLRSFTRTVNRLGDVRWCCLDEILDTNRATRRDGTTLHVRSYADRLQVEVPDGVDTVAFETPPVAGSLHQTEITVDGAPMAYEVDDKQRLSLRADAGTSHRFAIRSTAPVSPDQIESRRTRPWPVTRRILTESRDRTMPVASSTKRRLSR